MHILVHTQGILEKSLGELREEVVFSSFLALEVKYEGLLSYALSLVLLVLHLDVLDLLVFPINFLDGNNIVELFQYEEL